MCYFYKLDNLELVNCIINIKYLIFHMNSSHKKESQDITSLLQEAEKSILQLLQCAITDKNQASSFYDASLFNMKQLVQDEEQTADMQPQQETSFFDSIPIMHLSEDLQQRILNLKLNFVTSKRKDQLFKRFKKQQQEKIIARKRAIEKLYYFKLDQYRSFKGEYTLKKQNRTQTCSIAYDDLQKLKPETDLNDTIIGNYLKYVHIQVFTQQVEKCSFIYSSFFLEKLIGELIKDDPMYTQRDQKTFIDIVKMKIQQNYKNVKRWTKKLDIFQKQYLVIPVNAFRHWYCVMVANPGALIKKSDKQAYIIYCDSMFQKRNFIVEAVRTYLQLELVDKKNQTLVINEDNLPCYQLLLPRQTNTHDCGLYMLCYIEHLLSKKQQLQNLHIIENRKKLNIFPRTIVFSMRERVKNLFISLATSKQDDQRKHILKKYKQQSLKIIQESDLDQDYDSINQKQFRKYESMNYHMLQNSGVGRLSEQELEYLCMIKFYIDPQINYYQRDKIMFM